MLFVVCVSSENNCGCMLMLVLVSCLLIEIIFEFGLIIIFSGDVVRFIGCWAYYIILFVVVSIIRVVSRIKCLRKENIVL